MDRAELQAMLAADERHWWYRGRRRVLRAELDRLALPAGARILDAGCGSGRTLVELRDYGVADGIEFDTEAAEVARGRGIGEVRVGRVEELPWPDGTFDLVTCLDVIEHTPDDRASLRELRRVVAPGGFGLVTVPAYQALWSKHDVVNRHYRRYRMRTLRAAAADAGWRVERVTGFNTLLLPPAAVVRLVQRARRKRGRADTVDPAEHRSDLALTPGRLNAAFELPLRAEAAFLRRGGRLPGGLSLLAVLRNPSVP